MLRAIFLLLALAAAAPARAQTCFGSVHLQFSEATGRGRLRVLPARDLAVTAEYFLGDGNGLLTAEQARRDPAVSADGTEVLRTATRGTTTRRRLPRLIGSGSTVRVATGCGLALVHLRITYRRRVMTLDVYRAPDHVATGFDAPVPFREGRYVVDFWTSARLSTGGSPDVYAASAVRPAGP